MINGLGGLVAMMASHWGESRQPIDAADADKLAGHIRDLQALLSQCRAGESG